MKIFVIIPILFSVQVWASDNFMEFGNVNFGRDFKEKSKWIVKAGVDYIQYPAVLPKFEGQHETIESKSTDDLNGYNLSFGRDFYIGGGFSTLFSIGAQYSRTVDKVIGKAAEDIDLDFSQTTTAYQVSILEASLAFNYMLDYKIVDIQPFIEFGVGAGQSELEKEYKSIGLSTVTDGDEDYDMKVKEDFALTRVSLGVNLISYKGLMSYFKFTGISYLKTNRETTGRYKAYQTSSVTEVKNQEDDLSETATVGMVSVGIGRYF